MLLFKKILNFKGAGGWVTNAGHALSGRSKNLKAKVTLVGRDGLGQILK